MGQFFKKETLSGDNKYFCEKCQKKHIASKGYVVEKSPDTMFLHLKRFNNHGRKIGKQVRFPDKLSLRKVSKDGSTYELYGIIVHSGGSLGGGHYYAYCKIKGEWHCVRNFTFKVWKLIYSVE